MAPMETRAQRRTNTIIAILTGGFQGDEPQAEISSSCVLPLKDLSFRPRCVIHFNTFPFSNLPKEMQPTLTLP